MAKLRFGFPILMVVLFVLVSAVVAAPVASASSTQTVDPVILVATVIDRDPGASAESGRFLVQVEELIQGTVPGSGLVVSSDGTGVASRALPEPARLAPGRRLHMVLRKEPDGSYRVLDARLPDRAEEAFDLPPGIVAEPPLARAVESGAPRLSSKATATAPYEHQVVELTNEERWANGNLPPLKKVAELESSAGLHSDNMANRDFFSHCDPDTGTNSSDRISAAGYTWYYAGENIAAGYATPSLVVAAWMASNAGHREAILNPLYRELGVGYRYQSTDQPTVRFTEGPSCSVNSSTNGPYFRYWTQNFGTRYQVYPLVIERELWETPTTYVALYVYGEGWAQDMRFSNDGASWSAWETYSPNKIWTLSPGAGEKTVWGQVRRSTTVLEASDTIHYVNNCTSHLDVVDPGVQTVNTTQSWTACDIVTSGDGFQVGASGNVTFQAKNRVVLRSGFSVASGGSFAAGVDPSLE